ncbi:MAG: glycosyltransferase family 4 protein [Rhodospirillaceae bacterium]|jgi:alpha-maltose-1-phosphate synthase|nr:glycosyltransferase family 4 protein [Rhodospirillaceae bacterium]MBT6118262.1 glycosyltransferase family 4 protein [Rhodospirillaceae bacterium]
MNAPKPRTVVSHGGSNPLAYQVVAMLAALGYPYRFETGFYYRKGALAAALRVLPPGLRGKVERQLGRRRRDGIDSARVGLYPWPEMLYVAAAKLGLPEPYRSRLRVGRAVAVDKHVARILPDLEAERVLSFDTFALHTLRAAHALGVPTVLSQCTGHLADALAVYREELALNPDFADSLAADTPPEVVERCAAEAREADRVLAPSAYVRETLERHGVAPDRIVDLPYGVDSERFHPPATPRSGAPFRVLYVGQIGQKKGIKYLLEAMRRLALPDAELLLVGTVVGSGAGLLPYRDGYRHIPGVPYHEVHDLFRDADIFVYPSLHEGSPFAVLEAMASGLPVITTPNAGTHVRDGVDGFVVPIRDIDAMMARIEELYRDRDLRLAMGRAARERASAFTWQRYADGLDAVLTAPAARERRAP